MKGSAVYLAKIRLPQYTKHLLIWQAVLQKQAVLSASGPPRCKQCADPSSSSLGNFHRLLIFLIEQIFGLGFFFFVWFIHENRKEVKKKWCVAHNKSQVNRQSENTRMPKPLSALWCPWSGSAFLKMEKRENTERATLARCDYNLKFVAIWELL